MPRVNLNRDAPLNEAAKKFYEYVRAGFTRKQLYKVMGYSHTTDCQRVKNPELFTLKELRILYREANLPDEVFMRMIREDPAK